MRGPKTMWSLLPVALLGACGGVSEPAGPLGQGTQGVLYAPPVATSGNVSDSTTFLGPVALGSATRTFFTQAPQFYAFQVSVPGTLQARFEVTHEGSSMSLDTGLQVYGPRNASGSYGTHPLRQNDNGGYGGLSRIDSVQLTAGEYLVVVGSGQGTGKEFRLETTCLSGACPAVPPANPGSGGLYTPPVASGGDVARSTTGLGPVALGGKVQAAFTQNPQYYAFRVSAPGALTARFEVTHGGSSMGLDTGLFVYGPRNASGSYGASPRAVDDDSGYGELSKLDAALPAGEYLVVVSSGQGAGKQFQLQTSCLSGACPPPPPATPDVSGYGLALTEQDVSDALLDTLATGEDASESTEASLRRFDFTWPHATPPTLTQADVSVMALRQYDAYYHDDAQGLTAAQAREQVYAEFLPAYDQVLATHGNGTERVQVAVRYHSYLVAAGASGWFRVFFILFPESKKIVVLQQTGYET